MLRLSDILRNEKWQRILGEGNMRDMQTFGGYGVAMSREAYETRKPYVPPPEPGDPDFIGPVQYSSNRPF